MAQPPLWVDVLPTPRCTIRFVPLIKKYTNYNLTKGIMDKTLVFEVWTLDYFSISTIELNLNKLKKCTEKFHCPSIP